MFGQRKFKTRKFENNDHSLGIFILGMSGFLDKDIYPSILVSSSNKERERDRETDRETDREREREREWKRERNTTDISCIPLKVFVKSTHYRRM